MALPGFQDALNRKYDISQQEADAHSAAAQAQAALYNANAGQVAANAQSQRQLQAAQGGLFGSQANLFGVQAQYAPLNFASEDALRRAQTGETNARTGLFGSQTGIGIGQAADAERTNQYNTLHPLRTGTAKVPGAGDGTVDTQPAMLAPGEAVLNKAAAEHLGRDTIALLNAIGSVKMGLPQVNPQNAAPEPKGDATSYAKGTAKVPGKAAGGKAAPKAPGGGLSPEIMQAIMSMGQGGMPPPGSQPPMPMPMPQVASR